MARSRSSTPAAGIPALAALLVGVFFIAVLLVYEAWSTGQSRREIAQRGLQDYAAYATWSTARAGDAALAASLSTLFRGMVSNHVARATPLPSLSTLTSAAKEIEECDCALAIPADYYFRADFREGELAIAAPMPLPASHPSPSGWAAAKVGSF